MNIVIVGSGNVATSLGRKFISAGHNILQIVSRNADAASELADEWNTRYTNDMELVEKDADLYLIAVPDTAIAEVVKGLKLQGKTVVHTAASVPMDILKNVSESFGVFYPLQSLRKEIATEEVPIYVEAIDGKTEAVLGTLARSIHNAPVYVADFEKRAKIHVAAVFVNNFTNHLFSLAEDFCREEGLEFDALLPLIDNTIARLHNESPSKMQTGPAARKDLETIAKHELLLKAHPKLLKVYQVMTESILAGQQTAQHT